MSFFLGRAMEHKLQTHWVSHWSCVNSHQDLTTCILILHCAREGCHDRKVCFRIAKPLLICSKSRHENRVRISSFNVLVILPCIRTSLWLQSRKPLFIPSFLETCIPTSFHFPFPPSPQPYFIIPFIF